VISAHAAQVDHAVHLGFAIFCVFVVVFCVAAAKWTAPKAPPRERVEP
jgi:hypothetical protein